MIDKIHWKILDNRYIGKYVANLEALAARLSILPSRKKKGVNTIRWGILGTGSIAKHFAKGLSVLPDAELIAVGSRSQASADLFATIFNIPHRHATYEALAQDPEVDVIYIATPHSLHKKNSILCLQNGKAVLCEKPFMINAAEAKEVITFAREKKLFLMEAMWTRFFPLMVKLRELVGAYRHGARPTGGAIGDVRMITADFGFRTRFKPKSRLFDPNLGGGALLDLGIYPLSLASMLLGPPTRINSMAHLGQTGVDEQAAVILGYEEGQLAILHTATRTKTPQEAILMGTDGQIRIEAPWWRPASMTLSRPWRPDKVMKIAYEGNGYNYQAAEVMNCLRAGKLESDIMPLDETLSIMHTMDKIRAQWGMTYPME